MEMIIAERLKELRKQTGLNKTQLAHQIGVSDTAIGKWENGTRQPNLICLWKLSKYFDVSIDYLVGKEQL